MRPIVDFIAQLLEGDYILVAGSGRVVCKVDGVLVMGSLRQSSLRTLYKYMLRISVSHSWIMQSKRKTFIILYNLPNARILKRRLLI